MRFAIPAMLWAVAFVAGAAIYFSLNSEDKPAEPRNLASLGAREAVDASRYQRIGHDLDNIKGNAFSEPVINDQLVDADWKAQPIKYDPTIEGVDLAITLDQQIYGQLVDYVNEFARKKNIKIAVNSGTCGVSAKQLRQKNVDIGGFCCPPGEGDRLPGLQYHTLGIVSMALFTHNSIPLKNISTEDARAVFRGDITRWSDLEGMETDLRDLLVITRLHCKGRPGHWTLISGSDKSFAPKGKDVGDIQAMFSQLERYDDTIGYETLYMYHRENSMAKILRVDGLHPGNLEALTKGYYPFYRVLNITTWSDANNKPVANELVAHLQDTVARLSEELLIAPALQLKEAGWKFEAEELVGEPVDDPKTS